MSIAHRFTKGEIEDWANRYISRAKKREWEAEENIEQVVSPSVRKNRSCSRSEFLALCDWKTPRTRQQCERNEEGFIREVTSIAFTTPNERLRIEVLTLLEGVNWPTASVLLHFGHVDPYPILDFRALESLGIAKPPTHEFSFWWKYVQRCRQIASDCNVPMRTLDRALWAYSKFKRRR